jgi:hypothetical protein
MKRYELYGIKESGQKICYGLKKTYNEAEECGKRLVSDKKIVTFKIKGVIWYE